MTRSLFELLLNVEEIHRKKDQREQKAKRFMLYDEFQRYQNIRAEHEYDVITGRISESDNKLANLDRSAKKIFHPFLQKTKKGKKRWISTWCGKNVWELSEASNNPFRLHQYKILYSYMSMFSHNAPLSVMTTFDDGRYERDLAEIERAADDREKRQLQLVLFLAVIFSFDILINVGEVLPDFDPKSLLTIMSNLYRLYGADEQQMKRDMEEALKRLKRKGAVK